jgi:hypothetical protein
VALIHVVGADMEAERLEDAHAADTQDDLLLQAALGISAIEAVCDRTIPHVVLVEIRVEQEDRHAMTKGRAESVEPRADPHLSSLDGYRDHRTERLRPRLDVPRVRVIDLASRGINFLPQVAGPARERHKHDRQFKVGAGSGRVPGKHPKAAAVGPHLGTERDLHRKIGNIRALQERIELGRGWGSSHSSLIDKKASYWRSASEAPAGRPEARQQDLAKKTTRNRGAH